MMEQLRLTTMSGGFSDLEEDANATLKAHLVKLIDTTKRAEDNPNLDVDTSNANVGLWFVLSYDTNNLYAVQKEQPMSEKLPLIAKVGSWYRGSKNEAWRCRRRGRYLQSNRTMIFSFLNKNGEYFLFIRNFKSFEHTANFQQSKIATRRKA
ncbi:hypothetical protein P4S64_04180 [Vibrio sp. M60_M31a]